MVASFSRDELHRIYTEHKCEGARILYIGIGTLVNIVWNGDRFVLSEEVAAHEIDTKKCTYTTSFCVFKHDEPLTHPQFKAVQFMPDPELRDYIKYLGSYNNLSQGKQTDFKVCLYEMKLRRAAIDKRLSALVLPSGKASKGPRLRRA